MLSAQTWVWNMIEPYLKLSRSKRDLLACQGIIRRTRIKLPAIQILPNRATPTICLILPRRTVHILAPIPPARTTIEILFITYSISPKAICPTLLNRTISSTRLSVGRRWRCPDIQGHGDKEQDSLKYLYYLHESLSSLLSSLYFPEYDQT